MIKNEEKDSCTHTSAENEIINNDYKMTINKRKAVEFWKSGKKARYSLILTIQHRFKKVKCRNCIKGTFYKKWYS